MIYSKVDIGELVTLRQGFAINKKTSHHMSEEPTALHLLRIGDMKEGNFSMYVKDTIPEKFIAKESDIIYTRTGQVGLVFRKQHGVVHNNCFTVSTNDESVLDQEFLYYVLQEKSFYEEAISKATGAAQPDLPHGAFNSIQIFLPPIESQKKITRILNAYNELIENNQKQIKLLEEAAQRLYKEWFVDLRFPGHEDVAIVDGVPEGWEKDKAERFFNITIGKTPPRAEKQWFVNGNDGVPWLSISDMGTSGVYSFTTSEGLTQEAVKKHNMKVVPAGTIFVSFKLTVGRVSIATTDMCTNEAIAHFYIDDEFKQAYTYCYLNNFEYDTLGNTSSISKAVNSKIIKAMPFVMPDEATILAFDRIVEPILKEIKNKQIVCIKLKEARDRLLPKLMNGEIEV